MSSIRGLWINVAHVNYARVLPLVTKQQRTAATGKLVVRERVFPFALRAHVRVPRCSRFQNI